MHPLPIGKTDHALDFGRILTIPPGARRGRMPVFGKRGVGKSTLPRNMIAWDIEHGAGAAARAAWTPYRTGLLNNGGSDVDWATLCVGRVLV